MAIRQSDAVEVKRVKGKGRGVFARRAIRKGEVFETCPVLVVPAGAIEDYSTGFGPYVFEWGEGKVALALGFGSLYNHSYRPNARYNDVGPQTKAFKALRDIAPGEEVTVNYNGEPARRRKVWFDVVEETAKPRESRPDEWPGVIRGAAAEIDALARWPPHGGNPDQVATQVPLAMR